METLLKKQNELLTSLEKTAKRDELIQIAQLYEEKRIDNDGDRMEDQLKDLNTNVKKLNEKTGDNLNSNVIKLTDALREKFRGDSGKGLEATPELKTPRPAARAAKVDPDETARVVDEVSGRRRYNEFDNVKKDLKDLFSARGFLDKMGIARRGESGLISDFMDKRENRKNWVESRMRADPNMKNLKQYGGDEEKVKQYLTKRYDEKVGVEEKIFQNKEDIAEQRKRGMSDEQIKRMGLFKKQDELATQLKEIDPSLKQKPQTAKEQETKATEAKRQSEEKSAKVLPFTKQESAGTTANALSNEETMLEQNKMIAEQTGLLKKIEENTSVLKTMGAIGGAAPVAAAAAEGGGGPSILDMIPGKKILGGLKSAGKGIVRAGASIGRFALKHAGRLGAVGAVGMGLYEGYQGWTAASDKQDAAKEDIQAKLEAGEITQGEANQLTKQVDEQATEEKGAAAGKGTGMALGGAAGALKGAAAGAAIGSVVPVVGTVVGGAIGATVGAIGGSWLGGKGGEWLGKKAGQAKNWAGNLIDSAKNIFNTGTSGKEAAQNMETEVAKRMQDEGVEYGSKRANEIRQEVRAEIIAKDPNAFVQSDQVISSDTQLKQTSSADGDTSSLSKGITSNKSVLGSTTLGALFTKKGLQTGSFLGTSSKEGNGTGTYSDILGKRTAGGLFGSDKFSISTGDGEELDVTKGQYQKIESLVAAGKVDDAQKLVDAIRETKRAQAAEKAGTKPTLTPPPPPNTGDTISQQSSEVDAARLAAGKPASVGNAIVNAPTVNNTTKTSQVIRSSPRTQENSVSRYLDKRYA